jgi:hypothetical protein
LTQLQSPLRFAVMLQNEYLKHWQFDVIDNLIKSKTAIPVLLIFNAGPRETEMKTQIKKPNLLWRMYEKCFLRKGPLSNILLPDEFSKIPRISCHIIKQGRFSEYFDEKDAENIREFNPDFILRFGFSIIRGDILETAPYGIWSFHHSDEQTIRGGPAGFWEVFLGHKINGVILQKLTKHLDGGIILKKRFYKTTLHDSALNLHHILNSSTSMPVQVCWDILNGTAEYFKNPPVVSTAKIYTWPGYDKMILFTLKQICRRIKYNFNDLFLHEKWALGAVKANFTDIVRSGIKQTETKIFRYKSNNKYPADPFAIHAGNGLNIFFESYDYKNGKAGISSVLFNETSGFGAEKKITDNNSHQSFPFIFVHKEKIFMIPEQIEKGRVDLYQWDEINEILHFEKTLLDIPLADTALTYFNNKWWLFGSAAGPDVNNSLNIYYSDSLDETFVAHPQNPVVFDPRGARMAGLYTDPDGKLWRFAQESHITYGKNIRIYEVTELSTSFYCEKLISRIDPFHDRNFSKGIHTLSVCNPYIVFDGKKYVFSFKGFYFKMKSKIRNRRNHV